MKRARIAIDFCISPRVAAGLEAMHGRDGFQFLHLSELIANARTRDEVWAETFKRWGGQFVISGDSKIAFRPHQAIAFMDSGLTCVFPEKRWNELRFHEKAALLVHRWPCIRRTFENAEAGSLWGLQCQERDGTLSLKAGNLKKLELPRDVAKRARDSARKAS